MMTRDMARFAEAYRRLMDGTGSQEDFDKASERLKQNRGKKTNQATDENGKK